MARFPTAPAALLALLGACGAPGAGPRDDGIPRVALPDGGALWVQRVDRLAGAAGNPGPGGAAPPLVVPGAAWLEDDLRPLQGARELVFYDPRGRGRSARPSAGAPPTLDSDVRDLEALLDALGLERVALLGWWYHGAIAVRFALAAPERVERLVLVAPLPARRRPHWTALEARLSARADAPELERVERLRAAGVAPREAAYHAAWLDAYLSAYGNARTELESRPFAPPNDDPEAAAALGQALLAELGDWDFTSALARLAVPVLVVHGEHDPLPRASAEEYVAALPDARLAVVPAGHLPWLDAPEPFFAAVAAFLEPAAGAR